MKVNVKWNYPDDDVGTPSKTFEGRGDEGIAGIWIWRSKTKELIQWSWITKLTKEIK